MERVLSGLSASCSSPQMKIPVQRCLMTRVFRFGPDLSRREGIVVAAASRQAQAPGKAPRPQGQKVGKIGRNQGSKVQQTGQAAPRNGKRKAQPQTRQSAEAPARKTTGVAVPSKQDSSSSTASGARPRLRIPAQPLAGAFGIAAPATRPDQANAGSPAAMASSDALERQSESGRLPVTSGQDGGSGSGDRVVDGVLTSSDPASASQAEAAETEDESAGSDWGDSVIDTDEDDIFPQIQLKLPPPTKVKVKTAEYLKSAVAVSDCPLPRYPEFAVIGRSNVGKSSLINMMTGQKGLALVSKEPGKTKCINHFFINKSWYLVDLPGYGYAKVGLQGRLQFDAFTKEYFTTRPNLAMVLLLVDASIPPQRIDLEYANWLTDNEVPFALVFTKADKRRKGLTESVRDSHVTAFKRALLQDLAYLPPSLLTSSAKGQGRGALMALIASLRVAYEKSGRLEAIRHGLL